MSRKAWQDSGARRPPVSWGGRLPALVTLVAMLTSGCLGHYYEIPRAELERLAHEHPKARGENVYAVQQFTTAAEPEPAPPWYPPPGEPPPGYSMGLHGYWVPDFYVEFGMPYYLPPEPPQGFVHGASPATGTVSGGGSGGGSGGSIGDMDRLVVVLVVVGIVVGIVLAATEGVRYEGSVAVHPEHPVHLWHRDGTQSIVRLDELTPEHLRDVSSATLSGREGAGMWLRGAAPLNREGFSYQFGAGDDQLALPGGRSPRGLGFRFGLGYFPTKTFGILTDTRLQSNEAHGGSFYNVRLGLEAQWYPISLWRLHLGPFVGGGQSWFASEGGALPTTSGQRPYVSAGVLAELELTTRLGLTFRWGQDWLPSTRGDTPHFSHAWSVGFAVY